MSGTLDSGVIGDRIDVYEDRVSGVEGWAQYRYGEDSRGQSRELFMRAVKDVFPVVERHVPDRGDDLAAELAMLYDEARCGAFHDGMTRRSILLQQTGAPISISAQRATPEISAFVIDPAAFVDDI